MSELTLLNLSSKNTIEELNPKESRLIFGGRSSKSSNNDRLKDVKGDGVTYFDGVIPCNPFAGRS